MKQNAGMRQVGNRTIPDLADAPSGSLLAEGARFSEDIARLAGVHAVGLIPKGVYRFKSHAEQNAMDDECLARAMAELAERRDLERQRTDR